MSLCLDAKPSWKLHKLFQKWQNNSIFLYWPKKIFSGNPNTGRPNTRNILMSGSSKSRKLVGHSNTPNKSAVRYSDEFGIWMFRFRIMTVFSTNSSKCQKKIVSSRLSHLVFPLPINPSDDPCSREDSSNRNFLWFSTWFQKKTFTADGRYSVKTMS